MTSLLVLDRSLEDYNSSLALQDYLVRERVKDSSLPDALVLVEHSEVYTMGRSSASLREDALASPLAAELPLLPYISWIETNRGGQVTFHGPGQLVGYPVFNLDRHGRDVHVFLRGIEQAIISALGKFGFYATTREGLTGVWLQVPRSREVEDQDQIVWRKVASIGIGVKKWVSYHGFSINVDNDLRYFKAVSPCGMEGELVTSLKEASELLDLCCPQMTEVKKAVQDAFCLTFGFVSGEGAGASIRQRPSWLKVRPGKQLDIDKTGSVVRSNGLVTVCEEAKCPNIGECWAHSTATFMIMGELCTRRCGFCSVQDGYLANLAQLDQFEPFRVARAAAELSLKHVVITSVNRDDLPDMGAGHFDQTVRALAKQVPGIKIELLIPDLQGRKELLQTILSSDSVNVLSHNVETVPRLYSRVRPGARFSRSLDVLKWVKELKSNVRSKTGLMVGLGETFDDLLSVMDSLREVDCDVLTIGQYLQPTAKQLPIVKYYTPEEFAYLKDEGLKRGFRHVESSPFVRSSYHAWKHAEDEPELRHERLAIV